MNGDLLRDDELKELTKETVVYWFNKPEITDTKRAVIITALFYNIGILIQNSVFTFSLLVTVISPP